ncbi:MAG: Hpt domain-containing protein, partial [Syntrophomonas sp.]|nr:Hpt domain-containing protein [Syntrophomonas sp.]
MKTDMSKYLDVFLEESKEHLESLNARLLEIEKEPSDSSALNEIFRAAHTLKGMSSTMGFNDVADLTHNMENVLADIKTGSQKINAHVVDALFKCFDRLQLMVDNIENSGQEFMDNTDLISVLANIKSGNFEAAAVAEKQLPIESKPDIAGLQTETNTSSFIFNNYDIAVFKEAISQDFMVQYIKIEVEPTCIMKAVRAFMVFKALEEEGEIVKSIPSAQDLDEGKFEGYFEIIYLTKQDIDAVKKSINHISEIKVAEIRELSFEANMAQRLDDEQRAKIKGEIQDNSLEPGANKVQNHKGKQTVRVDIERLDQLMNLVGELVMHKGRLEQIGATQKVSDLNETIEQIDRISTDLQSVVMKVRMVPIEQVFNRFPRMVRDLAKDLGKDIDFLIEGKETELDRTVIDEIGDPLIH